MVLETSTIHSCPYFREPWVIFFGDRYIDQFHGFLNFSKLLSLVQLGCNNEPISLICRMNINNWVGKLCDVEVKRGPPPETKVSYGQDVGKLYII